MDHDELADQHTAIIRRHWRTLSDNGGRPSEQLLADLAAIADQHALDKVTESHAKLSMTGQQPVIPPPSKPAPPAPPLAGAASRPRRTTVRKTTK